MITEIRASPLRSLAAIYWSTRHLEQERNAKRQTGDNEHQDKGGKHLGPMRPQVGQEPATPGHRMPSPSASFAMLRNRLCGPPLRPADPIEIDIVICKP